MGIPLVHTAGFENYFCGHEQKCAGIYGGGFPLDYPLQFSQKVTFYGRHARIVELKALGQQDDGGELLSGVATLERTSALDVLSFANLA